MIDTYEPHEVEVIELQADDDMGVPRVDVVVHPTVALLNEWRRHEGWASTGAPEDVEDVDSMGVTVHDAEKPVPFEVHLAAEAIHLSVVAHEAVHVALWHYAREFLDDMPGARASAHISRHGETIPYAVGNLAALIWYQVLGAGFVPAEDADVAPGIP